MKKFTSLVSALLITGSALFAEPKTFNNPGAMPPVKEKGRPTVALVLSGGGINGAAEVPVLEEIDRLGIPVDMIFGTSIGAIVGGLYAAGYTTESIYDLFFTQNWPSIFADFSPTPYENLYANHGTKNNLLPVKLGIDGLPLTGKGITSGQKAYQMLKQLTYKYPSNLDFDNLPIPFRAVGTDMITGEPCLLSSGDLAEAIRASMNVAGLFEPLVIDGHYLLDGGLTHNMPVQLAKQMGYDIVIAVEIGPSSEKSVRTYESVPLYSLQDSIYIPMKLIDKMEAEYADLTLYPDMSRFEITDFEKADEIYNEGVKAVQAAHKEFEKIRNRIYPNKKETLQKKDLYTGKAYLTPETLVINNSFKEDNSFIQQKFNEYKNKGCTLEAFVEFTDSIYNTGHYKHVFPRIITTDDETKMELTLTQKPSPVFMVLAGATLEQTASTQNQTSFFDLNLAMQFRGFTTADSLLSLRGTFLNNWGADLLYFQPVTKYGYFSIQSDYIHQIYGTYKQYTFWTNSLDFGGNYFKYTTLKNGICFNMSRTPFDYNSKDKETSWNTEYFINYAVDLQNQPCFTEKGFYLNSNLKYGLPVITQAWDWKSAYLLCNAELKAAIPLGDKFSIRLNGYGSYDIFNKLNSMNGILQMEGNSNYNRIYFPQNGEKDTFNSTMVAGSLTLQFAPVDHLTIAGGKMYILASGTWGTLGKMNEGIWSASAGFGIKVWDSCNFLIRLGAASTPSESCVPFASLDLGALKF